MYGNLTFQDDKGENGTTGWMSSFSTDYRRYYTYSFSDGIKGLWQTHLKPTGIYFQTSYSMYDECDRFSGSSQLI